MPILEQRASHVHKFNSVEPGESLYDAVEHRASGFAYPEGKVSSSGRIVGYLVGHALVLNYYRFNGILALALVHGKRNLSTFGGG
jgi:hypothetical protein